MSARLALICAFSFTAMATTAVAQPDRAPTEVFVSNLGVDFSDPAETATYYAALERAAARACESSGVGRTLAVVADDKRCAEQALDRAVQRTGESALASLHESQTGRATPGTMLAANQR